MGGLIYYGLRMDSNPACRCGHRQVHQLITLYNGRIVVGHRRTAFGRWTIVNSSLLSRENIIDRSAMAMTSCGSSLLRRVNDE